MTTSYPAGLDSYTNPTATDELDDEIGTRTHSEFHADNNDAIEAIQAELGTDPSGASATVKARIEATETVANAALPSATAATTYQPLDADLTALAAAGNSTVLANTTASFLTADETKLDGIEALADVTDATNVSAAGAAMISSGAGAPASTPAKVGNIYIDTTADRVYVATDTASSADWDLIPVTAAQVLALLVTVDGSGSGLDADTLRGTTPTAAGLTLLDDADASAQRTTLGLAIGTNVQAWDADLDAVAALTTPATTISGAAQKASNLSDLASAATAFGNIKQAASDTATGVVELATDAETITGTDTARAVTPANITALVADSSFLEKISDQVGAMVTGNTETNIAVTYQDADNTLDFVVDAASESGAGVVELATTTEATTGTDTARAVTAAGVKAVVDAHVAAADPHTGYVQESLFDAHTILAATSDNTPAALTVGEQTLVGRVTAGNIAALTASQVRTLLDVPTTGEAVLDTLFDANTILAANSDNTPAALTVAEQTLVGRVTGGNIDDLSASAVRTLLDVPTNAEAVLDTLVDAKGDLLAGTAADTITRLAVGGTNGHVLTVDSAEATGMKWAAAGGGGGAVSLAEWFADVGNVGSGEDDLFSLTMAAGQLATNGDKLSIFYRTTMTASATGTRDIRLYFGGTNYVSASTEMPTFDQYSQWYMEFIRVSSTAVRWAGYRTISDSDEVWEAPAPYSGDITGLTLSGAIVVKVTGEATVDDINDDVCVAHHGHVIYTPAA